MSGPSNSRSGSNASDSTSMSRKRTPAVRGWIPSVSTHVPTTLALDEGHVRHVAGVSQVHKGDGKGKSKETEDRSGVDPPLSNSTPLL